MKASSPATVERSVPNITHQQGAMLVLATGVLFSFGGLAFRSTDDASAWEYLTFRGVGMLAATTVMLVVQHRGRVHRVLQGITHQHVLAGVVLGVMNATFIVALSLTTVAFVLFLQPTASIFAAYFSWLFMRERVSRPVLVATPVTFVGVAIMVSGTVTDDLAASGLIALLLPLGFGFYATTVRSATRIDPLVPIIIGGISLVAFGLVVTTFQGGMGLPFGDALIGIFAGSVLLGFPLAVFNTAQRVVPSPETSLLLLVEVILAPIWVWVFVDEDPETTTLLGGAVILAAVAWLAMRRPPRRERPITSRG